MTPDKRAAAEAAVAQIAELKRLELERIALLDRLAESLKFALRANVDPKSIVACRYAPAHDNRLPVVQRSLIGCRFALAVGWSVEFGKLRPEPNVARLADGTEVVAPFDLTEWHEFRKWYYALPASRGAGRPNDPLETFLKMRAATVAAPPAPPSSEVPDVEG